MEHTFKWFLPTSIRSKSKYIEFDITKYCKTFFAHEFYFKRKISFDKQYDFDQTFTERISEIKLKLHPFTDAPMSNTNEAELIIEKEIGNFQNYQHIVTRGNLRRAHGLVIIEIKLQDDLKYTPNLKSEDEYDIDKIFNWNHDFEQFKSKMISIANDICSFFLLGMHITYPTHSNFTESSRPQTSGLLSFEGGGQRYIMDEHSDMLSYPLFFEEDRLGALKIIWGQISQVWHKDIWSFHRFIKGVRSNYTTIDNFLDLVFTLESFFNQNTSTETMRLISSVIAGKDKSDAKRIDQLLADSFRIRNEVVHGGVHYRLYDYLPRKPKGNEKRKMIMHLYWELKNLNIILIYLGIQKLIKDKNPVPASSIRFGTDDILNKYF